MQLVANQQLVKNRARLGTAFHIAALAVFGIGLFISLRTDPTSTLPVASWSTIILGLILYSLGQTQLRRWGPRRRQEESLGQAIKGLDDRYKLYAFLSTSLPDYILVSPAGVSILIARDESGQVICQRDKWQRAGGNRFMQLFEPGLGNPSGDAQKQLQKIQTVLAGANLADVPTSAAIVFTSAKVQLRIEGCSFPVTRLRDLKDVLRRASGKGQNVGMSSARVREVQGLFDQRMRDARAWR
ncbi:MAG: hypothetical protein JO023_16470 [Chloroflexi bacterium]|nr:hypothetical protein [Chloroflexota bacterium]